VLIYLNMHVPIGDLLVFLIYIENVKFFFSLHNLLLLSLPNVYMFMRTGSWCCTPLSKLIFQLYRGGQFYWWSETGVSGENHRHVANHWQTLLHKVVL